MESLCCKGQTTWGRKWGLKIQGSGVRKVTGRREQLLTWIMAHVYEDAIMKPMPCVLLFKNLIIGSL